MDLLDPPIDRAGFEADMLRLCEQLGRDDCDEPSSGRLVDAMRYIVGTGGKRFRGAICVAAYRYATGRRDATRPPPPPVVFAAAAAVEMIHAASLALDDLPCMDDADVRRGSPCVHRVHGEAVSILASSALVIRGIRRMLVGEEEDLGLSRRVAVCNELMVAAERMAMGQIRDLEHASASASAAPLAEQVRVAHAGKTGALIAAAATIGAMCGCCGGSPHDAIARKVVRFGTRLGLAYQIVDDIIDATGAKLDVGKPTGADRGSNSFVAVAGLTAAVDEARRLVRDAVDAISADAASEDLVRLATSILKR